jgi:hypothetical protein
VFRYLVFLQLRISPSVNLAAKISSRVQRLPVSRFPSYNTAGYVVPSSDTDFQQEYFEDIGIYNIYYQIPILTNEEMLFLLPECMLVCRSDLTNSLKRAA